MKEAPYCKFVAWCSSITSLMKWKAIIQKEIQELKVYITHSGNETYQKIDEYESFYELKPKNANDKINAILLNVNIVTEGCDIDYVDTGIFLDPVKDKNIVTYLQSAGRICRTDVYNKKTHANIIYTYLNAKDVKQSQQIISYFEMLMQLTEINDDYYKKMTEMFDNLKLTSDNELRFVIDKKKEHDCVLYLDKKIQDWDKIKHDVNKIINDRRKKYRDDNELIELNKLKKYEFCKSKIEKCIINNKSTKLKNYKPIFEHIYEIINDVDKIMQHTTINIIREYKIDKGYTYLKKLKISVQGVDANTAIYEIFNLCCRFNINVQLNILLTNSKKLIVNYENNKLNITEEIQNEKNENFEVEFEQQSLKTQRPKNKIKINDSLYDSPQSINSLITKNTVHKNKPIY
jgi:hypothetical protein